MAGLCYDFKHEEWMRQIKRLLYIVLLNIIISAATVLVILNLWERNHPPLTSGSTPVVILVTPTQSVLLPAIASNEELTDTPMPTDTGIIISAGDTATPSIETVAYRVKEGDTLGALSTQFNISVADIMTVNGLIDPDSLYVGEILYIPTEPLPTITPTSASTATPTITLRPPATATHGPTVMPTDTQPDQEAKLMIKTVLGAGVLANEHIVLQRTGDGELPLAGWRVDDGAGNSYTFPQLTLYKDGTVNLHTRQGEDTVSDLFWGLSTAVWKAGKTVYLYDADNVLRASYTIR
jgi:LysM repeat protein